EDIHDSLAIAYHASRIPHPTRRVQSHLIKHRLHNVNLLLPAGMRGIDDVEQQIRGARLLERGAERSDQMVRQLADEPDRVGDAEPVPPADVELARERIERREQSILYEDVATRERAQDARLPRVGVAHQ